MNSFLTWVSEHMFFVLYGGLAIGLALALLGGIGTWKTARRLRVRPRPWIRFVLSVFMLVAGAGVALFFGSGVVAIGPGLRAQQGMIGAPAPELPFALVADDRSGKLADHRGQVVLVNVWATWCPPCIDEMPELDRLQSDYRERGLVVLHLSDESRETLLGWLEQRPTSAVHVYAEPLPWPDTGRPTTFVVDRDGVVRRVIVGQRSYEDFAAEIEGYL